MFAIVDIAGFQEKVTPGAKIRVPTLADEDGQSLTVDKVLMLGDGATVTVGAPFVSGASVVLKVLSHGKHDKVRGIKMRRRKRYTRVLGHRQGYTELEVVSIKGAK